MIFKVERECGLLPFLLENMPDKSRTTVKSYLKHRQVSVNGCAMTQHDTPLVPGDNVAVTLGKGHETFRHPMMRIVYEDEHIIVIDKRNGLLSIATDKEQKKTAYYILSEYVKRQDPANRIFILHRLDRETSGLMMFARSAKVQETMQRNWRDFVSDRRYVAVVEGRMRDEEGVIESYLKEDRNRKMWVAHDGEGSPATTRYRVLAEGSDYSMLDLKLETGQKNQIRAHLEWAGAPIAGDKKYGARTNPAGRVCLHAYKLFIVNPVTEERLDFSTRIPQLFEETAKGVAKRPAR